MRHRISHLWLFLAFAWTLLGLVSAAPAPAPLSSSTKTLYRRLEDGELISGTVVTESVEVINTPSGLVTEKCIITLTPVTGKDGEALVQVIQECILVPGNQTSGNQTEPPPPSSSTAASASLSSAPPSTTSPPPASTSSAANGVSVIGFSSVSISPASNTPSPTPPPPPPSTTKAPIAKPSTANSMSAAADNTTANPSSSAAAAFQIPGKKISVLPIGLGIFAGISVIALIVVGLVTYERTKYRKIFRQRKLAEQGATIGYS